MPKKQRIYDYFSEIASEALHIVIFENFVKSMTFCLSKLIVTPSFCLAFKSLTTWPHLIIYVVSMLFPVDIDKPDDIYSLGGDVLTIMGSTLFSVKELKHFWGMILVMSYCDWNPYLVCTIFYQHLIDVECCCIVFL